MSAKNVHTELPKRSKNSICQLHEIFNPGNPYATTSRLSDVVLIGIDFENTCNIKSGLTVETNCEAGIAILDIREIKKASAGKPLKTFNFVVGTPLYVAETSNRFVFGKTIIVEPSRLVKRIESLVPRGRNVVFVGHGVTNDLLALQALKFRFPNDLVAVMDTLQVAREMRKDWVGSLGELLRVLGCPHTRLHCAGNDANFALKALLLLAAMRFEKQVGERRIVDDLRRIGRQELPDRTDLWVKAIARRDG
jgi:hypothetical protein